MNACCGQLQEITVSVIAILLDCPQAVYGQNCGKHVPNLMAVLVAAAKNIRRTNLQTEDHRNAIIMCVAILMKQRSPRQLNYLQTHIGLMQFDGHATKRASATCHWN